MNAETIIDDYAISLHKNLTALLKWRPIIERILENNKCLFTFTDLTQMLLKGERLFFNNDDAFLIVQVHTWSKGIQIHMQLTGGTKAGIEALEEPVIVFAQAIGAKQITGLGRKGFKAWQLTNLKPTNLVWYIREL